MDDFLMYYTKVEAVSETKNCFTSKFKMKYLNQADLF